MKHFKRRLMILPIKMLGTLCSHPVKHWLDAEDSWIERCDSFGIDSDSLSETLGGVAEYTGEEFRDVTKGVLEEKRKSQ